jgi:hypothetical protein
VQVRRALAEEWKLFQHHHYLSGKLNRAARCFVGSVGGRDAAFTAVLSHPDRHGGYWREHRTVCLPDFQGVGIGHAVSEFVASLFAATGKRYLSVTSHPGMIAHRLRSPLWKLYRRPSFGAKNCGTLTAFNRTAALCRRTAGFKYVGSARPCEARQFGLRGVTGAALDCGESSQL